MGKKAEEENQTTETPVEATEENTSTGEENEELAEVVAADDEPDYQAEAEQNKDLYLRALADLQNYRKRAQREKEDAIRFANENLLREMVPVIDNLERAIEHAGGESDGNMLQGVQMTLEQFRKVLDSFGVKPIEAVGQPFDPNFHQAMGQIPASDQPPNTVVEELQKGYILNNRLLRPAMVMVAKADESSAAGDAENEKKSEHDSDSQE